MDPEMGHGRNQGLQKPNGMSECIYTKIIRLAKLLAERSPGDRYYDHIHKDDRFIIYWKLKKEQYDGESLLVHWRPDHKSRRWTTIVRESLEITP